MIKVSYRYFTCIFIPLFCVACSTQIINSIDDVSQLSSHNQYVKSGTISMGFDLPKELLSNNSALNSPVNLSFLDAEIFSNPALDAGFSCGIDTQINTIASSSSPSSTANFKKNNLNFSPLVGFFPLSIQFKPADNEVWIQIDKEKNQIEVYKGKEVLKVIAAEGDVKLAAGEYPLQHKQRNPLWYAPDEYFSRRELRVPPRGDHFRYRRGALGNYALYPTMDFVIHSGPFWSEEVGGLKVSEADLAAIFVMMNVGTPIIVK